MRVPLRLLCVCLVFAFCGVLKVYAQSSGTGWVQIAGSLQGPIYPCGNSTCPTYDSGQITITVNGFRASTTYKRNGNSQTTPDSIAKNLTNQLNVSGSPVTATRSLAKITIKSKATGTISNYPLSTLVAYNSQFATASFSATASGPTLTGGNGGPTPVGTLIGQTSNNTSLCSSSSDPGGNLPYCNSFFNGFTTNSADVGAETPLPGSPAGHVSNVSIKQLMYPGWNGRLLCEYQPWFGLSTHKSVGYNENSPATVAAQNSAMLAEGCDIVLVDFYGALDTKQAFNLATTNALFADLGARPGYPLQFGILEDKGALKSSCPTSLTESATVTCLQNALITEMDFINSNYANAQFYWSDAGQPVVAYFGGRTDWPVLTSADWTAVWNAVKAHTDTYSAPFKFVFQFGTYTTNSYDNGRYGWPQPAAYSSTQQFWWGSGTSASPTYLDTFYSTGLTHLSQLTIAVLYKGFDDNAASWGGNRVIAQQCGQVLLKSANEISKYFGGSNPQVPYAQVVTWNDYEEGTAAESGVDNCYTVNASISGTLLNWSLVSSDATYASPSTVHHFTIYFADAGGNLYTAAANIPVSTSSMDLASLVPPGTWTVYVEMVGQPLIINRMSNAVTLIH